jgi:hypothetical protein
MTGTRWFKNLNSTSPWALTLALLATCLSPSIYAQAKWRVIAGTENAYSSQFFTPQPINIPSVSDFPPTVTIGNTSYTKGAGSGVPVINIVSYLPENCNAGSTSCIIPPGGALPLTVAEDYQHPSRQSYTTRIRSNPYIGLEAPMSDSLLFRIKAMSIGANPNILNTRTLIMSPLSALTNSYNTVPYDNGQFSFETLQVSEKAKLSLVLSFLYRLNSKFYYGFNMMRTKHNFELALSDDRGNNSKATFRPKTNDLSFETLYRINDYMSLTTSFQFSKKKSYIKRLLNFRVNKYTTTPTQSYTNSQASPTTFNAQPYYLTSIPLSEGWQACEGYTISGSRCNQSGKDTKMVSNYYYNQSTPSTFGTNVPANSLDTTLGPQLWYTKFGVRVSVALEFNLDYTRARRNS